MDYRVRPLTGIYGVNRRKDRRTGAWIWVPYIEVTELDGSTSQEVASYGRPTKAEGLAAARTAARNQGCPEEALRLDPF